MNQADLESILTLSRKKTLELVDAIAKQPDRGQDPGLAAGTGAGAHRLAARCTWPPPMTGT